MAMHVKNMTTGKPAKLLLGFSFSLMAGNVFQQLYVVVDTMVVGKYLGVTALAALGASDWLNWLMLGVIQGLTQGFGIRMAQDFGAGRIEDLKKSVGSATVLSMLCAVVLLVIGQLGARPMLILLQTPPEIIEFSLLY
ncbi:MAG: MATE family efflux transporter, partial [Lachnospiraceae bacterium]|nr:MATE family efflux transporter [Lachnospiraceae bacterium]